MADARARWRIEWPSTASCTRSSVTRTHRSCATPPPPAAATQLGDVCDPRAVAAFAREREIDIAMVSADEPLAAGVVDALLAQGTRAVGPTAPGAEIEWNKAFARSLLAEVAPEALPRLRVARDARGGRRRARVLRLDAGRRQALRPDRRQGREGDGSRIWPATSDARDYALELLARGGAGESVPDRGEDRRRRVHHPGDQRRPHGRVPAVHLRLSLPLRRRSRVRARAAWARCRWQGRRCRS